jgi:hypothetical protein
MMNFFIRYCEEKHKHLGPQRNLQYNNRILYFTSNFYKFLTNGNPYSNVSNYDAASKFT